MEPELLRIASRVVWWDAPEHVVSRLDDFLCRVTQRRLWTELRELPTSFVLYSGTALALRVGGRES